MRKQIALPTGLQQIDHQQPADLIKQVRHYQLITPLYGGGVEANTNDLLTLIRGSEIRGQLRFWWRATRGCFTHEECTKYEETHKDKYKGKNADEIALSLPTDILREREGEIWGKAHNFREEQEKKENKESTKNSSQPNPSLSSNEYKYKYTVQINVKNITSKSEPIYPFKLNQKWDNKKEDYSYFSRPDDKAPVPAYAAFPLQLPQEKIDDVVKEYKNTLKDKNNNNAQQAIELNEKELKFLRDKHFNSVIENVSFDLELLYPEKYKDEIEAALWAWETFGGIGARTRRGFGALKCTTIEHADPKEPASLQPANAASAKAWIEEQANKYIKENGTWPKDVPHLSRKFIDNQNIKVTAGKKGSGAIGYWGYLITKLHGFRQARSGGYSNSQRSRWPEPDAIRKLVNQKKDAYKTPLLNPPIEKFPRAAFGLPIIFKFKDDNPNNPDDPHSDPAQRVLQPEKEGIERFASPLILKPISCLNNTYAGLAIILEGVGPEKEKLELRKVKNDKKRLDTVEAQLAPSEYTRLAKSNQAITDANAGYTPDSNDKNAYDIRQTFLRYLK